MEMKMKEIREKKENYFELEIENLRFKFQAEKEEEKILILKKLKNKKKVEKNEKKSARRKKKKSSYFACMTKNETSESNENDPLLKHISMNDSSNLFSENSSSSASSSNSPSSCWTRSVSFCGLHVFSLSFLVFFFFVLQSLPSFFSLYFSFVAHEDVGNLWSSYASLLIFSFFLL